MKKYHSIKGAGVLMVFWLFSLFLQTGAFTPQFTHAATQPPIYVSMITHNEDSTSGRYPDFTVDEEAFWEHREAVVAFADMLIAEGVSYNWQPAWTFLEAARVFDVGTSSTNGENIVAYLQSIGVSVNVHGHPGEYSYADDAYLIDALGAAPSGVMGGFLATPSSDAEVEDLWQVQHGSVYSYSWTPTVLWGAASAGHRNDDDVQASGIWKPQSDNAFLVHDDDAPLPVIGTHTSDWDGLDQLLTLQEDGALDSTVMHTAAIMVDQDELLTEEERDAVLARIRALEDSVAQGKIVWMNLEDVLETWEVEYNETPSIFFSASEEYLSVDTDHESSASSEYENALIKTECFGGEAPDDPCKAVYYVTSDGMRHAFPNEKVFFTWYADFDDVYTVSSEQMAQYQIGKNVTYHPGTRMVKFPSINTVYVVAKGGVLRSIASEEIAAALYGTTWNQKIDDISEAFYGNYTFGPEVDAEADYDIDTATASVDTIGDNFSTSLAGTTESSSSDEDGYVLFSINTQDFSYPEQSAAIVERIIDLHEAYEIPVDIYLTTTMVDLYESLAPDLLDRLRDSPIVAVNYHTRPPLPYHYSGDYDWIGLAEMTEEAQYETIMEYETHGLDLALGTPTAAEGGYAHLTEAMGYAPPIAAILGSTTQTRIAREVYGALGALFTVDHGTTYDLGDMKNGLYLRPEHYDLRLFEHVGTDDIENVIESAYQEALAASDSDTYFLGIKMHDNDFFAENSAWTTVYQTQAARTEGPPYDTSLVSELLSDEDQAAMWSLYEETVRYVAMQNDRFTVLNAFDLQEMVR